MCRRSFFSLFFILVPFVRYISHHFLLRPIFRPLAFIFCCAGICLNAAVRIRPTDSHE